MDAVTGARLEKGAVKRRVVVVHSGALGDSIMTWPLLRALVRSGWLVSFVARGSHARLAARWLGEPVRAIDVEHPVLNALWRGGTPAPDELHADLVLTFLADDHDPAGRLWHDAACESLGANESLFVDAPGTTRRQRIWQRFQVETLGSMPAAAASRGLIVLHLGAGSRDKQWGVEKFAHLRVGLLKCDHAVELIAGEVERERFDAREREVFSQLAGRFVDDLDQLADSLSRARLVVAADTGPAHLAAQLGVPTLALFGPTDPTVWAPVGPRVRVLAPPEPQAMSWLKPEVVLHEALAMLRA